MINKERLGRRVPRNFYEGKARDHNLVEGEIGGLWVAIGIIEDQIRELYVEYEAGIAEANDMTVAQYREEQDRAAERRAKL